MKKGKRLFCFFLFTNIMSNKLLFQKDKKCYLDNSIFTKTMRFIWNLIDYVIYFMQTGSLSNAWMSVCRKTFLPFKTPPIYKNGKQYLNFIKTYYSIIWLIKTAGSTKSKQLFWDDFYYYLDVFESITRVNIIGSLQKWYQRTALSLSYKKLQTIFSKIH